MGETDHMSNDRRTHVERGSDHDLSVTRSFDAPVGRVFEAWVAPALFKRWWAPKSLGMTILSCEMDVRTGGGYRLEFGHPDGEQPMVFYGKYREVLPGVRLVWTNEESEDGAVTTVTFEEKDGKTQLVLHERHRSREALEESFQGMESCMPEQFDQLDALLASLKAG